MAVSSFVITIASSSGIYTRNIAKFVWNGLMGWERAKNRRNCSLLHSAGIGEGRPVEVNAGRRHIGSSVGRIRIFPVRNFRYLHVYTKFYLKSSFSKDRGGRQMASINPREF